MNGPPDPRAPAADALASPQDRQYAMLIQLSGLLSYRLGPLALIVTLALWMGRKDESPFINDHGREAMNYKISMWIYKSIAGLLVLVLVGCFILPALIIFDVVVVCMGAVAANNGRYYRYPITIRFIPS